MPVTCSNPFYPVSDTGSPQAYPVPGGPRVYIAGYYNDELGVKLCYWVNGARTDITDLGVVNDIAVFGGRACVAGSYYDDIGNTFNACYWVNGMRGDITDVPDGTTQSNATGIAIVGGNVYIAGTYFDDIGKKACYWVDGTLTGHIGSGPEVYPGGIAVVEGSVYVAGYYDDDVCYACYWKGGVRTDIIDVPLDTIDSFATDIAVVDGKVYVAGSYYSGSSDRACYWVDGERTDITDVPDGTTRYNATGIAVAGGKVYVAGSYYSGSSDRACYWVNGARTDITDVPAGNTSFAYGIAVE